MLLWLHVFTKLPPQLFDQLAGAIAQARRNFDRDLNQLIAATRAHAVRKTLTPHAQHGA